MHPRHGHQAPYRPSFHPDLLQRKAASRRIVRLGVEPSFCLRFCSKGFKNPLLAHLRGFAGQLLNRLKATLSASFILFRGRLAGA